MTFIVPWFSFFSPLYLQVACRVDHYIRFKYLPFPLSYSKLMIKQFDLNAHYVLIYYEYFSRVEACIAEIGSSMAANLLKLHQDKTELILVFPNNYKNLLTCIPYTNN